MSEHSQDERPRTPSGASRDTPKEDIAALAKIVTIFLATAGVTILSGLIIPQAVLLTVPILVMLGFRCGSLSYRINHTKGLALGCSPLVLVMVGLPVIFSREPDLFVRFLLVGFGVIVIPLSVSIRSRAVKYLAEEE
jgi:hypothetical protein